MNEDIFTPKIGYCVINKERFKTDVLIGIRYWHFGTTLDLQPSELNKSYYAAINWVDAVEGAKFQALLTPKVMLTIGG